MSIAGLREEPAQDWLSLHKRLASDGLYITMQEGELVVKDGWDRAREGVALSSFGPLWTAEKLGRKLGEYQPVPTDIFSQVGTPGRYDPEAINVDIRPEKVAETESLKQYACRHFAERLPEMASWKVAWMCTELWQRLDYGWGSSTGIWYCMMDLINNRHQYVQTVCGR